MVIGVCTLELYLADPESLKDKRGVLKSLISRLHREFNVAAAEVGLHDARQSASIGIASISTSAGHAQSLIENILRWIEHNRPDVEIVDHQVEIIAMSSPTG
jgi:uncharacterized protein YlxP (DUF503 family)